MTRKSLIALVALGAAVACLVFGMMMVLSQGSGEFGSTSAQQASGLRWFAAIVAGVLAGLIGWSLISARGSAGSGTSASTQSHCSSCGGVVLDDWRLCPHCGVRLVGVEGEHVAC